MIQILIIILVLTLVACTTSAIHVNFGGDGRAGNSNKLDSNMENDMVTDIQSSIKGIDKSQQKIENNQEQQRDRDYQKDRLDPTIPKATRKSLYKRDRK